MTADADRDRLALDPQLGMCGDLLLHLTGGVQGVIRGRKGRHHFIANRSVYKVRVEMGRQLAREFPIAADVVVPVPDSGNCAGLGYSLESGIPYEMAFVRNHYVGRSFLQPSQLIRDFDVRVKLNLIDELVRGKRVIVVDDSIVRGTTCKARVNNLKEAGAKEVHVL